MHYTRRRRCTRALLGAGMLAGLMLGSAHAAPLQRPNSLSTAGSIVYQSGNNIWIARPDGSHRHPITRNGKASSRYEFPTQADNGTVEALVGGTTLVHMDRNAKILGPQLRVASGPSNQFSLHTMAVGPAISPNGQRVAVSILEFQGVYNSSTGTQGVNIIAQDMEYWNASSGKRQSVRRLAGTYLMNPSWIDNNHVLMFAPYNISAAEVYVDGPALDGWDWFSDPQASDFNRQNLNNGELSRAQDKLMLIRGRNLKNDWRGATLQIYTVSGLHTAPTPLCTLHAQHGSLAKPTWSPDGTTIAWSDSNGIWESPVQPGSANCGRAPKLVIRGASNPDWGPTGVAR